MPRIITRSPSSGAAVRIALVDLPTGWTNVIEAPDFDTPDSDGNGIREVTPGEVFMSRPLNVTNKTATLRWMELRVISESGAITFLGRWIIPGMDQGLLPVQGLSLFKLLAATAVGDRLQARAELAAVFDLFGSALEKSADIHDPVTV